MVRTGPVHRSRRETRETSNREVNGKRHEGRVAGRKLEMGLNLKNLKIYLNAWVEIEGILATFVEKCTISGRRTTNPEITASAMKRGERLGRWLGVTGTRED